MGADILSFVAISLTLVRATLRGIFLCYLLIGHL
jgi:hypothetical protein